MTLKEQNDIRAELHRKPLPVQGILHVTAVKISIERDYDNSDTSHAMSAREALKKWNSEALWEEVGMTEESFAEEVLRVLRYDPNFEDTWGKVLRGDSN